jgi:hypothetical protein
VTRLRQCVQEWVHPWTDLSPHNSESSHAAQPQLLARLPLSTTVLLDLQRTSFYLRQLCVGEVPLRLTLRSWRGISMREVPLQLDAIQVRDALFLPRPLSAHLTANYVAQLLLAAPALVLSLDILGNPAGWWREVRHALQRLAAGHLLSGSAGVLRGVCVGTIRSVSDMSHALQRTLCRVHQLPLASPQGEARSLPPVKRLGSAERVQRAAREGAEPHEQEEEDAEVSAAAHLVSGVRELSGGVLAGLSSVLWMPAAAFARGGLPSVPGGVVRGLASAVSAPVAGAFGLLHHTTAAMLPAARSATVSLVPSCVPSPLLLLPPPSESQRRSVLHFLPALGALTALFHEPTPLLTAQREVLVRTQASSAWRTALLLSSVNPWPRGFLMVCEASEAATNSPLSLGLHRITGEPSSPPHEGTDQVVRVFVRETPAGGVGEEGKRCVVLFVQVVSYMSSNR